ncbi:MAG: hypothetical protein M3Y49_03330, partial [Actinomycetota bacterium]|nr:hypothetical protein [Actinomycetota bacterium]
MRRVLIPVGCVGVLFLAGCGGGSAAPPPVTSPGSVPPSAPAPTTTAAAGASSTAPSATGTVTDQVGGSAYASSALTPADLPAGYAVQRVTAAQDFAGLTSELAQVTVTPSPKCLTLGPLTADTAKTGLLTVFVNATTRETIAEFVAPAGNPSLAAIASDASGCTQYTVADPSKGVHQSGAIQVVPTPAVAADKTLGLKTTTVTTTAGGPPVTTVQTDYLAETKGTLVTINTKGGPTGNPIDPTVVAAAFTKAVTNT